ncbi:MAG: hypothetical protein A2086_10970 [Spirochaetes bacterium GWD1_27_9]|nr:MAG: hypothetical protein A2Z98_00060 [Spirochaetes bacterium GWB1_27_13]OHD20181.1 MAG: hypothetical protein A2Y34_05090 [Spirochaetes bacterium GWC1_27_15]OHD41273.1 MAG: hypothetical protein A2086_10970 [Spirochaetes bacterium GWD1_27_9]
MKKTILSIFFVNIFILFFSQEPTNQVERLYAFKILSFSRLYEIYFCKISVGYYKYPITVNNEKIFINYETKEFYEQCLFDENKMIYPTFYPMNIWVNNKGEALKFVKKYGPVINKNRQRKNYPYGFGKNY